MSGYSNNEASLRGHKDTEAGLGRHNDTKVGLRVHSDTEAILRGTVRRKPIGAGMWGRKNVDGMCSESFSGEVYHFRL